MKRLVLNIYKKGLFIGPFLFLVILSIDTGFTVIQQRFLAIFAWVICQWLLTSVPLFITGIFGVCLSILMGVTTTKEAFAPFSDDIIFLFMGGFLLAKALEVLRFDKKIALHLLTLPYVAGNLKRTILALYAITAVLSMWVSNTATTAMMIPIVIGIVKGLELKERELKSTLLLGVAYAATIGGLGTPIGSPPNLIALGMLNHLANIKVTFLQWLLFGLPLVVIMIYFLYIYTTRKISEEENTFPYTALIEEKKTMGHVTKSERTVMIIFSIAVILWFVPSFIGLIPNPESSLAIFIKTKLTAGVVSVFCASLLFLFPLNDRVKILSLEHTKEIDYPSLFLFGSGLSLGGILFKTGLAELASHALLGGGSDLQFAVSIIIVVFVTIFFTELASNTASANIIIPMIIAASLQNGHSPLIATIGVALACNMAFMLPVATPPNTIVYGSGEVKLSDMIKEGLGLNFISFALLAVGIFLGTFLLA